MAKLSVGVRAELRLFAFLLGNGTLCLDVLDNIDYIEQCGEDPSALEQMFAIWANHIEIADNGSVLNGDIAARRAAQWLRRYHDAEYVVEPPFEDWELELA